MNRLLSINSNVFYYKIEDEFVKMLELVFIIDKAKYIHSADNTIPINERQLEDFRFIISHENYDKMIDLLKEYKEIK